jgi:hypothetical protein
VGLLSADPVSNPTLEVHPHTIKTFRPGVPKCQLEIDRFGPNWDDPRKRHGRQALIYAYWGYRPPSPDSVFATYRLRFGIESSYRQMHEARIRTTTRRPVVRLLYVGIALVLRNLWVWLHYTILSMPRRGGRVILLERLRWETLLLWLLHVVEEAFGVADVTYTEREVLYELAL